MVHELVYQFVAYKYNRFDELIKNEELVHL